MSQVNNVFVTIPTGDGEIDLFAETGMDCLILVRIKAPVDEGQVITFQGLCCWDIASEAWSLDASNIERTLDSSSQGGSCCFSKAASNGEKLRTLNTGQPISIEIVKAIGTIDDCPGSGSSSSSSGSYEACDCCSSSSN